MSDSPTGVLLLQLGTPDAPTPRALRRYLREFLSDRRVIDLPRATWWPVLHFIVLPTRPRKSAALYRKVWTPAGSPLLTITMAQAAALESRLTAARGTRVPVVVGMRYGNPSIAEALARLGGEGVDRIVALPMFPQYASATTGSSLEQLFRDIQGERIVPSIRVVPPYYEDPSYIAALKAVICDSLRTAPFRPDRLLLSFHGLPKRYTVEGDPYADHCRATAARLERSLALPETSVMLVFQSQFGREEWLQPYTDKTLEELGRSGLSVAVMCPGFTADCLETLEEIRLRGAEQFHGTGGKMYHVIPCLNDHPAWIEAMATIVTRELGGWT
jgi:ferrochelatase